LAADQGEENITIYEGVLADALGWPGPMAKARQKHPEALRRDGAARFVWFLDKPDTIDASLRALAALARGWLGRGDAASKALVASVGLAIGDVEAAEEAANALTAAGADKSIEGRISVRAICRR
jgi:hypothetical protein